MSKSLLVDLLPVVYFLDVGDLLFFLDPPWFRVRSIEFLLGDLELDLLRMSEEIWTNGAVFVVMKDLRLSPMPYSIGRVDLGSICACQFSPLLVGG